MLINANWMISMSHSSIKVRKVEIRSPQNQEETCGEIDWDLCEGKGTNKNPLRNPIKNKSTDCTPEQVYIECVN